MTRPTNFQSEKVAFFDPWFLYLMVAHFTSVEGLWLHRKSRQIREKNRKRPILHHTCATCSEVPSYISTMHEPIFTDFPDDRIRIRVNSNRVRSPVYNQRGFSIHIE